MSSAAAGVSTITPTGTSSAARAWRRQRSASALRLQNLTFLEVEDLPDDTVTLHCVWRTTHENPRS